MNLIEQAKKQAAQAVLNAYHAAVQAGELPEAEVPAVAVEIPKDTKNGDYASLFCHACAASAAHGSAQDRREHHRTHLTG